MSAEFDIVSMKMAISLIVVMGLIISLVFILKRFRFGPLSHNKIPVMRVLGTLSLAPKRAIALVEICDQLLIVGIGTESVTLISKLDRPAGSDISGTAIPSSDSKFHSFLENIGLRQRALETRDSRENIDV